MGQSTDGILCFGIRLSENYDGGDEQLPWSDEESSDFEEWYAKKYLGWDGEDYSALYGPTGLLKTSPPKFQLVRYCSCESPMYILALNGTVTEVSQGYIEVIDPLKMFEFQARIGLQEIEKFALANDIELSDSPHERGWLLVSDWC